MDLEYFKKLSTVQKTESSIFLNNNEENEENNPLFNNLGKEEWVRILNDSTFTLKIGNNSTCEYINIIYGNNNVNIKYNYFRKILENKKYKNQKYFIDFKNFAKFLEELKNLFNVTFNRYRNFELIIKIKFETTFYSGNINIQCNYETPFIKENRTIVITEINILNNKDYNSFNTLIRQIDRFLIEQYGVNNKEDLFYQEQEDHSEIFDNYIEFLDYLDNINNN